METEFYLRVGLCAAYRLLREDGAKEGTNDLCRGEQQSMAWYENSAFNRLGVLPI